MQSNAQSFADLDALEEELDAVEGFEAEDAYEEDAAEAYEEDAYEEDALEAYEEDEAIDVDTLEEELDAMGAEDAWEDVGAEDDGLDEFGDFAIDQATGLYVPNRQLITGPAAMAIARRLNPQVLEAMDADDADAFFRRIGRGIRGLARGVRRVAGRVGGLVQRGIRAAAPLLQRALPMIQRVAGLAGPWGRLVSAGIGGIRGLMSGQGLRGALAGAVGGLIPGIGGQIASSLLGGADGADDDGALDALADMADAGEIDEAVAFPLAAGLSARLAARHGMQRRLPGGVRVLANPHDRRLWRGAQAAERIMVSAARAARGSTGARVRTLRQIGRLAAQLLRRRPSSQVARALPAAVRTAARRVVPQARSSPAIARTAIAPGSTRAAPAQRVAARRRNAVRRRVLQRVPAQFVFRGSVLMGR